MIKILLISIFFIGCSVKKNNIPTIKIDKKEKPKPKTKQKPKENKYGRTGVIDDDGSIVDVKINNDITLLYSSKKLGQYAIDASNTSLAYLITKNKPFNLKTIDMSDESKESFTKAFNNAKAKNITKIIAIITNSSYQDLISVDGIDNFKIFLPLINKNSIINSKKNIIYGGIDYKKQLEVLSKYSKNKSIELYDNSLFGKTLNRQLKTIDKQLIFTKEINNMSGSYARLLKRYKKKMLNATLYINTPIVKSSILLSQIRSNELELNKILSTQINYSPLILSLTQSLDRENLLIANSIGKVSSQLKENLLNLGCDVVYDWLTYSTLIGIDYFDMDDKSLLPKIVNGQVQYDIKLYEAKNYSFTRLN